MHTIRLEIEYDGANYIGWQWQPEGLSLQKLIEEAIEQVVGQPVRLHSSGRTDAGVHARGLVAHFKIEKLLSMRAYREGVNHFLPKDVAIVSAIEVSADFHARFSAVGKWYRYSLWQGEVRAPLLSGRYWHVRSELDFDAMRSALAMLIGCHDFSAFRSSGCQAMTTEREIVGTEILLQSKSIHIDIAGDGFLRNMVRIIVGTIVEIGLGKRPVSSITELLEHGQRSVSGITAPSAGLCLMKVWYEMDLNHMTDCFNRREKP
jgi:tRNA pseudouridine38-40 synthase